MQFLSRSGSAVLTERSALSLSWSVYQDLSTALAISSNLTDCQSRSLNVKLVLDLEYLATFLARVPRLQLYHSSLAHSEFHGLIHLEGLEALREVFRQNETPKREVIERLSRETNLPEKKIYTWFCNQRQTLHKAFTFKRKPQTKFSTHRFLQLRQEQT